MKIAAPTCRNQIFLAARFEEKQEKPENTWPRGPGSGTSGNGAIYRQKRALTVSTPYPAHPYDFRFRGAPRKTGNLVSGDLFREYLGNKIDDPGFWALIEAPIEKNRCAEAENFLVARSGGNREKPKPRGTRSRFPESGRRDTSGDTGAEGEPKTVYRSPLRLVVPAASKPKSRPVSGDPDTGGSKKFKDRHLEPRLNFVDLFKVPYWCSIAWLASREAPRAALLVLRVLFPELNNPRRLRPVSRRSEHGRQQKFKDRHLSRGLNFVDLFKVPYGCSIAWPASGEA
ncbi:hypothetical protein EVAR_90508_1 [Eumeta japonica]|uniref:Uncharacterized protein n=1 Tax=Eumeta variegata TaxID=151549 RepID=A0A4C2A693_EUMVA|nr:hypothetical protein EVAR_90508_1 [Eumeta japonica]